MAQAVKYIKFNRGVVQHFGFRTRWNNLFTKCGIFVNTKKEVIVQDKKFKGLPICKRCDHPVNSKQEKFL